MVLASVSALDRAGRRRSSRSSAAGPRCRRRSRSGTGPPAGAILWLDPWSREPWSVYGGDRCRFVRLGGRGSPAASRPGVRRPGRRRGPVSRRGAGGREPGAAGAESGSAARAAAPGGRVVAPASTRRPSPRRRRPPELLLEGLLLTLRRLLGDLRVLGAQLARRSWPCFVLGLGAWPGSRGSSAVGVSGVGGCQMMWMTKSVRVSGLLAGPASGRPACPSCHQAVYDSEPPPSWLPCPCPSPTMP